MARYSDQVHHCSAGEFAIPPRFRASRECHSSSWRLAALGDVMAVPFPRKAALFWKFVLLPPALAILAILPAIAARAAVILLACHR